MKKYLARLSLLPALLLIITVTFFALDGAKAAKPAKTQKTTKVLSSEDTAKKQRIEQAYANALTALNRALTNPAISFAFNQTQQTFLRTNIDLTVGNFFDNDPLTQMVNPMLMGEVRKDVQDGIRTGRIKMTELRSDSANHIELEVLEIAREVLRESGRTEKDVMSAKIFLAEGPVNAYTFSAQDGAHVIVLQTGLLEKLTYQKVEVVNGQSVIMTHVKKDELKAVFAHENGHIKSGHILQGIQNMARMMQLFKYFVLDPSANQDTSDDNVNRSDFWKSIARNLTPKLFGVKDQKDSPDHNTLTNAALFLSHTLDDVASKNPEQAKNLLNPYLDLLIKIVLQNGEMNGGILDGLVMLRSSTAVPGSQHPLFLQKILGEVSALMSREMETSADMFTFNSVARLFAAGVFTSFQGTPLTMSPELRDRYIAELISAMDNLLREGKEFYKGSTEAEANAMISAADVDHPQGPLRVENIIRYARTLDAMAMENPILKLVVTYTGLLDMERIDDRNQVIIQANIDSMRPLIEKTNDPQLKAKLAEYEKILEDERLSANQLQGAAKTVAKITEEQVAQLGYDVDLKSNPLLADALDFQLSRKIRNLWVKEQLTQVLSTAKTQEEKNFLQTKIEYYQVRFNDGDDLIRKIRSKVSKAKSEHQGDILAVIKKTLEPKLSIAEARSYRTQLTTLAGFEDSVVQRRARPAVGDENIDISRQSSNADEHLSLKIRTERDMRNQAIVAKGNFSEDSRPTTTRVNEGALVAARIKACELMLTGKGIRH